MKMNFKYYVIILLYQTCECANVLMYEREKAAFCSEHEHCDVIDDVDNQPVCGIRSRGKQFQLRLFRNECELVKFGCQVKNSNDTYGMIKIEFCEQSFSITNKTIKQPTKTEECDFQCDVTDENFACGVRQHENGFIVRKFVNQCSLARFNCERNVSFHSNDLYYCDGLDLSTSMAEGREQQDKAHATSSYVSEEWDEKTNGTNKVKTLKSVIIVDGSMFHLDGNINNTFENFAASTHMFSLPLRPVVNETTRRMIVKIFGPSMMMQPAVVIPKVVSDDAWHLPTLDTCYHKCPTKCPDVYAPVCGMASQNTRIPMLTFQNHCFMDAMQCKVKFDKASYWSKTAGFSESTFIMCLGNMGHGLYMFGPLVRTLQKMGRLKSKGNFKYKLRNLRHYNELVYYNPKLRG